MTSIVDRTRQAAIETPDDAESVARLLKKYADERYAIIPRGGGTMSELGSPVKTPGVILSLEKLNRILDHQPANLTVRVQAGATLGSLNQALGEHGQFVPLDPPLPARATIGGILASNASGALRIRYGTARDLVLGMRVALADGNIIQGGGQVVKNVAGYDLPKLFIGSLGTLGIIVDVTFKVLPVPKMTGTFVGQFPNVSDACAIALRVVQSQLLPISLVVLNRGASKPLGLGNGYTLLTRFGGNESGVTRQVHDVEAWSRARASSTRVEHDDARVWARVGDFVFEHETVIKIGVLPSRVGEIAAHVEEIAQKHHTECLLAAQALGIVDVALVGGDIAPAIEEMRGEAISIGGHLTIQRASGEMRKRIDVWGPTRSDFAVMQKLKGEFDPSGVLNPGRFVGRI
jgi:glycolate dehydrogenase FAD-binding subunit